MKSYFLSVFARIKWQSFISAGLIGLCCGFYSYSLFFQTTVFSKRYLLYAIIVSVIGFIFGFIGLQKCPFAKNNHFFFNRKSILIAFALFGLALPSLFFIPSYPVLPSFQHQSLLTIELETGNSPIKASQFQKIWLKTGVEPAGNKKFVLSEDWFSSEVGFILPSNSVGSLSWQGKVGSRATLSLPVPVEILEMKTIWDGQVRQVPLSNSIYFQNKNFLPSFLYIFLMNFFILIPVFFVFVFAEEFPVFRLLTLIILFIGFSLLQVILQFDNIGPEFDLSLNDAIQSIQLQRHYEVLDGTAANPWQYRILSEWIVDLFLHAIDTDNITSVIIALGSLRFFQNLVLLILAYQYFSRLAISKSSAIYGVFLLAVSMLHVFYDSDLSLNTYFDVIFYLVGVIIILDAHYAWLPILMIFATLNRETSGMIPIVLIFFSIINVNMVHRKKAFLFGLLGLLVWGVVFLFLCLYYKNAPLYKIGGILSPGLEYIKYNLSVPQLPILLIQTFGILPLVGLLYRKKWHAFVRINAIILVPIWVLIHFFTSVWAETRLFMVIIVIVIIPAVLPVINQFSCQIRIENGSPDTIKRYQDNPI